jgi:YfiH family protein
MRSAGTPDPGASWVEADWPAPRGVRAGISTRAGGVSRAPWNSLNLADHVGDEAPAVAENRRRLGRLLALPSEPAWLTQQHGCRAVDAADGSGLEADACYTRVRGVVCAVLTADCIPLLLADESGAEIAAVHVGWRGLCRGIAGAAVARFRAAPARLTAWIGPHITSARYQVGNEVRDACLAAIAGAEAAFRLEDSHWQADLDRLLRLQLGALGVRRTFGGGRCTFSERDLFFSHRRDRVTGRMAALIWLDPAG